MARRASMRARGRTRAAYPADYIPGAVPEGMGGHPVATLFPTADATGVLPPVRRLSEVQAMYHFLAGCTSKLAAPGAA